MPNILKFSARPGAHERHLQRKANNPLFPTADTRLLQAELDRARKRDQQDLQVFAAAFQETVKQAAALAGSVDSEVVLKLREELENLYVQSASLAGAMQPYQEALQKLIRVCMHSIRAGAADDPQALRKLQDEAEARQIYFELLKIPLVADLVRNDGIIRHDELVPSLLSEEVGIIDKILQLFDDDQRTALQAETRAFIDTLPDDIRLLCNAEAKLAILSDAARNGT